MISFDSAQDEELEVVVAVKVGKIFPRKSTKSDGSRKQKSEI
jgi:hypothetical protein